MRTCLLTLAALLVLTTTSSADPLTPESRKVFDTKVKPFLQATCFKCHGEAKTLAGLRIDTLETDFLSGKAADVWKEIYDRIGNGTMPPEKEARPNAAQAAVVSTWIADELRRSEKLAKGSSGRIPTRRLNRTEYANTLRDLFYLDENIARALEQDLAMDGKVDGFDRGGAGLFIDQAQMARYLETADAILEREVFKAEPKQTTSGRSFAREKVMWNPAKYRGKYTDLFLYPIGHPLYRHENERVTVPFGANWAEFKRGGLECVGNHRGSSIDFEGGFWNNWAAPWNGSKFADGWYRMKCRAGAFKGTGKHAVDEVRVSLHYGENTPLESKQTMVIDAPLEEPREFEMSIFLRAGTPEIVKSLRFQWNGAPEKLVIEHPDAKKLGDDLRTFTFKNAAFFKKTPPPTPQEVQEAKKREQEAIARYRDGMQQVPQAYVFNPEVDLATIPRLWLEWIEIEGPIGVWPPKGRTELYFDGETRTFDRQYIREIFARFLPRAWRRPVQPKEVDAMVDWVQKTQQAHQLSGSDAVREGVKLVLCSPSFLLLGEPAGNAEKLRKLTDHELACRLSYFLWSTMPDPELFQLAAENKLHEPKILDAQVRRMLADPKSSGLIVNFTGQWLKVRDFDTVLTDRRQYASYDNDLRDASWREPQEFFKVLLGEDLSILNFLDSDFLVINSRLAAHYGIEGVSGEAFRKVAIQPAHRRGGVLGMAGVLTFLTDGLRTLPVRRAAYVLDTLWNAPPPPPPPNVGDLPPVGKVKTVRERLELHRKDESCASCHTKIDPFGIALENYDAIGAWRDRQNGERFKGDKDSPALDVSGVLPSGRNFQDLQGFKTALVAEKEHFVRGFVEKMLTYALGRPVGATDRGTVEEIIHGLEPPGAKDQDKYRLQSLIQAIVRSQVFQTK